MSSTGALLVMFNNYFHDLATALFAVCGVAAFVLHRRVGTEAKLAEVLLPVVRAIVRVGYGAFCWIMAAGVVRAVTYKQYEWSEAAGRNQIAVLGVKHAVLGTATLLGLVMIIRLHRRMKRERQ